VLEFLADSSNRASLAARLRRKRFELFKSLIADLPRPVRILDVGGNEQFWERMDFCRADDASIVILNLTRDASARDSIETVVGDARAMPEFEDQSFDVVFSNSVIEHVGDWDDQRRMADEIRRVGRRYFVQTPNRYFPIEPHFLFPGFQFLPIRTRTWLLQHFRLGWMPRTPDAVEADKAVRSIQLLSKSELGKLFPDATLHTEVIVGLDKSFVAYRR
jgi:hypothetical protein